MVRFVVMAAGKASRMGQDKLALPWGDTTILGHVLRVVVKTSNQMDRLLTSRLDHPPLCEVVVVARKPKSTFLREEEMKTFENSSTVVEVTNCGFKDRFRWLEVQNPQPLAETLHKGLSGLKESIQGICFVQGDQVGINEEVLTDLTKAFLKTKPDFLVPQAGETTGSPVFFHRRYKHELMALQGEQGGRAVLDKYRDLWMTYPVSEEFLVDVDTPEEYKNEISKRFKLSN